MPGRQVQPGEGSPKSHAAAALVLLALALLGSVFLATKSRRALGARLELPRSGGGVSARWVAPRSGPSAPDASASGDIALESDRLRLVIGNDGQGMERHQRYGALLDFGVKGGPADDLLELRTVLFVGGGRMPLRTLGIEVATDDGRPTVTVNEASLDGRFELRTEYRLRPGVDYVELLSSVTNVGNRKMNGVELGDHGHWPGTSAFAPRVGHVQLPARAEVPWIGRAGRDLAYGLAFPERLASSSFLFDVIGPAGEITLGASADLAPQGALQYRRDAIVVAGGLGKVAEVAWRVLGRKVGHARGVLQPPPAWATVSAQHPDGRTVLSVEAKPDGSYELPLPAGEYRFVLQSPGGEDDELGTVAEGSELRPQLVPPRPGTLSYSFTDEQQQPIPGRLVVRGIAPTKDPELIPAVGQAGSKNMLYSLSGSGQLQLPPGRYDVLGTHGPEYSLPRQQLELNADLGVTFHAEFARVVDTRGYLAADFHVHASPSKDSNVPLADRVLTLAAEGVELAVATDHNHVTDYSPHIEEQHLRGKLDSMTGVEITTPDWGHFNAFPYPPHVPLPPHEHVTPAEIFSVVRARAPLAVLQVNHPRMPGVGYFNRGELDTKTGVAKEPGFSFGFDTLEVSNGWELEDPSVFERNLQEWFELLNLGRRYTAVGNSDSHRVVYQWAGWPRTYVRVPDQDPSQVVPADVARALTSGHAVVSCGIFVLPLANGSAGPGDTVQGSHVSLSISVRAPDWVDVSRLEIYANGIKIDERTRSAPLQKAQWKVALDLDLTVDTWLVVVARGDKFMHDPLPGKWIKPFGFSNPIFVDADGDGAFKSGAKAASSR